MRYKVVVLIEGGREPIIEEVEVEAQGKDPGATSAAFKMVYKKYYGKGYRYSFGDITEVK